MVIIGLKGRNNSRVTTTIQDIQECTHSHSLWQREDGSDGVRRGRRCVVVGGGWLLCLAADGHGLMDERGGTRGK